jgi:nifR3 family TIM-barrel protein
MAAARALRIGPIQVDPPVVLAPMAGVTDSPFRRVCASFGGALYVSEMVSARGLVEGHRGSWEMTRFHPDEAVRSLQLYGTDPAVVTEAVARLVGEGSVDHLDLNFGCPAPKVTRNGGGAALPVKRRLLRAVIRSAVRAADHGSGGRVPVTVKFRLGVDDDHLTFLDAGRIAEEEGAAAVALHARTALDHYGPPARWERIAELRAELGSVPVLGNGDVFCADDAVEMLQRTGCDGVVVGRGCLGRPWLFAELDAALHGRTPPAPPQLGEVVDVIRRHAELVVGWEGPRRDGGAPLAGFRKHLAWYLKGFPVGSELRRAAGQVRDLTDLAAVVDRLDPDASVPEGSAGFHRSHSGRLRRVALPSGWLDDPDEDLHGLVDPEPVVSGG